MIANLSIKGLAIIDNLSIDFSKGFNVITGETGAGKSILIRALNLLMGAKASSETVRHGFTQAVVSGTFRVPHSHPACFMATNLGIPIDESEKQVTLIVRRQVTAKGKSQAWVNDVPVTSHVCRELGGVLIDVFGQHENQKLLEVSSHTHYLDSFLKDPGVLKALAHASETLSESVGRLASLVGQFREKQRDKDYLSFRLEALREFGPEKADYESLDDLKQRAKDEIEIRDALVEALGCLNGAQGESLAVLLKGANRALSKRGLTSLTALAEKAFELAEAVDDLNYQLDKQVSSLNFDESEIENARARLDGYRDLFRKHGVMDIDSLVADLTRMENELKFLDNAQERIEEEMAQIEKVASDLEREAARLSSQRKDAAKKIKKKVEEELSELAMKGATFGVELSESRRTLPELSLVDFSPTIQQRWEKIRVAVSTCGEHGLERVQFLLASNKGEQELPLAKIASGGELSRIMLALKRSLAADADTCVLVFDEIDVGISGRVADVVGKKMQELSGDFQVICISHLPQVAVYADNHFLVRKLEKGGRTETSIIRLTSDESAKEIARLLSGEEVSKMSLANARSLIVKARAKKTSQLEGRA